MSMGIGLKNKTDGWFKTMPDAYKKIEEIVKKEKYDAAHPQKNNPDKIASIISKINDARLSVRSSPSSANMLNLAYSTWIRKVIVPLSAQETRPYYQEWMRQLSAAHAPLAFVAEDVLGIKIDVAHALASDLLNVQKHFQTFFGEDAFACPFVEYLFQNYASKTPENRKFIVAFILRHTPTSQITKELAEVMLYESMTQTLRATALETLEFAVAIEIEDQSRWQEIFRDTSIARRLFHCYAKRVSYDWLNFVFSKIREDICSRKTQFTAEQYVQLILERVRSSLTPTETTEVTKFSGKVPPGILKVTELMRDQLRAKFPKEQVWNLHMSQLFLVAICHCFRMPHEWGFPAISLNASPLFKEITPLLQVAGDTWETPPSVSVENKPAEARLSKTLYRSTTFDSKERIPFLPTPSTDAKPDSQSLSVYPDAPTGHKRTPSRTVSSLLLNN